MPEPVFEPVAEEFIGYYGTVRGHVRQEVIRARLQAVIDDYTLALDYGGGDARDSLWLAAHGAKVDYWDDSPTMQKLASAKVADQTAIGRVTILESDPIEDDNPRYDLVLLHGVLQYLEKQKAEQLLKNLARIIPSGGLLSLATKNFEVVDVQDQPEEGVRVFENHLGLSCRAYSGKYLEVWFTQLGFSLLPSSIRGVRCIFDKDKRDLHSVPHKELENIINQEKYWSTREDSINNGQMLHVIAEKK